MWAMIALPDTLSKNMSTQNQREKRKVYVKWVNDNKFPEISDFWRSIEA